MSKQNEDWVERYAVHVGNNKYTTADFYSRDVPLKLAKLYIRRADAEKRAKRVKGQVVVVNCSIDQSTKKGE